MLTERLRRANLNKARTLFRDPVRANLIAYSNVPGTSRRSSGLGMNPMLEGRSQKSPATQLRTQTRRCCGRLIRWMTGWPTATALYTSARQASSGHWTICEVSVRSPEDPDLAPLVSMALELNGPWFASTPYPRHASLLMGELGILLVQMRIMPDQGLVDEVYTLVAANSELPIVELMWGLPGCMLACIHMEKMTGDARFIEAFKEQANRLLAALEPDEHGLIWTQDLYGRRQRRLGPVHGFAGNMLPLVRGWEWLTPEQRAVVADAVPSTLAAYAATSELGCNWPAIMPSGEPPWLCQHCHGAPGIVTTFAGAPFSTPELRRMLLEGRRTCKAVR